jgi:hypothetical protein
MLRLYRSLLYLYPPTCRAEFGDEMAYVFTQAQSEIASCGIFARAGFCVREIRGLIAGALRAHILGLFGFHWVPFRRFSMRPGFRFPRSTVFLMCVILAGVILAIERAKDIQIKYGGAESTAVWDPLPWSLLLALALALAAVVAGWGILFALRRTGMHRLASVQTGPESR